MPVPVPHSHVLHRSLVQPLPRAVRAEGVYIYDSDGKAYLDASGGAAVSCLGHGHPAVIEAIRKQLEKMPFAHTAFFTNDAAEELADLLSERAPGGEWRVYFLSGGSEANEADMKLARQIQIERGHGEKDHFISRRQSYHGSTIGCMSISGRTPMLGGAHPNRNPFGPMFMPTARKIVPCYEYRWRRPHESQEDYTRRVAGALEEAILDIGPERVAAFIAETVVGATLGAAPPTPGYFKAIREICDKYDVMLIIDEVMCGMGRCGTMFAFEQDGIVPDIITLAKGLGGGYQPIGAMMVREEIVEEIERNTGAFAHGHTYVGHATACAAGAAVLKVFDESGLVSRSAAMGERLLEMLRERFGDHPHIGDIRGRAMFRGLEVVADRETKEPFPPSWRLAARIKAKAMDNGLIIYPMGGTKDRFSGDHILLAPPFIMQESHMTELMDKLSRTIDEAIAEARTEHGGAS